MIPRDDSAGMDPRAQPCLVAAPKEVVMSERRDARNEKERQQVRLEDAGWELVERGSGKTIWRNPRAAACTHSTSP